MFSQILLKIDHLQVSRPVPDNHSHPYWLQTFTLRSLRIFSDGCTALSWKDYDKSRLAQNWDGQQEHPDPLAHDKPNIDMITEAGISVRSGSILQLSVFASKPLEQKASTLANSHAIWLRGGV